jgi:hypothetical protein
MKEEKKINLPTIIEEFYVDCPGEEDDYSYNETEIDKIFDRIKGSQKMFKEIKTETTQIMDESKTFPILKIMRTLIYIDHSGRQIRIGPELFKEDEKSNFPVKRTKTRKEELETRSRCRKVEIKYAYYETKVYDINGKEVEGKECYIKSEWK